MPSSEAARGVWYLMERGPRSGTQCIYCKKTPDELHQWWGWLKQMLSHARQSLHACPKCAAKRKLVM